MKLIKKHIIILIFTLLSLKMVKAQDNGYKQIYLNFIETISSKNTQVLFYDIDNNNLPEMILREYKYVKPNEIYSYTIYTIENSKIKEIFNHKFTIDNTNKNIPVSFTTNNDILTFFTTNNDNNLYCAKNDINSSYNMKYYKLEYIDNSIIPKLVAETKNDFFIKNESKQINIDNRYNDKYFYKNIQISENDFINKMNFKQIIPYLYSEDKQIIEKSLNNFTQISSSPTFIMNTRDLYIIYNNGLYDTLNNNSKNNILMINGNIIPKSNLIEENNTIFLPLRLVCNYINKEINYNIKNKTINIDSIIININKSTINGKYINIKNINNNTYLPLDCFKQYFDISNYAYLDTINIISLEEKNVDLFSTSIEQAKIMLIDNLNNNINRKTYIPTNVIHTGNLGRYYIFKIDYKYIPYKNEDRYIQILYDKYSNNLYKIHPILQQFYNNKINLIN